MQRSVKKLRPKANKLKSFSANWKRGNKELNIELGQQIALLVEKETFPDAIALFFELPAFKRVLKNLKSGSLWKDVYVFTDEDNHPPEEILKVQNIANAFQRLCSIPHYPNFPKDPLAKAKLLTENIHDYLFTISILKSFKGKASKSIQEQLFFKQKGFVKELNKIINSEKELFLPLKGCGNLKVLRNLKIQNLAPTDTKYTHDILSRLYICSNQAEGDLFLCHKILNQMHKEIEYIFDAVVKNAPFFLPYALKKQIRENTKECTDSKGLYTSLLSSFDASKFQIIETKQEGHRKNVEETCINLHILEKSLDLICARKDLPASFKHYYQTAYTPIKHLLSKIHLQNSQIGYFLSGFFEAQISYLLELLNNHPEEISESEIEFSTLSDDIISFLERYAKIKPELAHEFIKSTLCFEHIKTLSFPIAKSFIDDTFSLLLPERNENIFLSLEKDSRKILLKLLEIYNEMDSSSDISFLLKEKIKNLYLIDIPSFSLGWYIFGEISSCLYILHTKQNENSEENLIALTERLYQYPIFSILLK